jgi:hypothetical protein
MSCSFLSFNFSILTHSSSSDEELSLSAFNIIQLYFFSICCVYYQRLLPPLGLCFNIKLNMAALLMHLLIQEHDAKDGKFMLRLALQPRSHKWSKKVRTRTFGGKLILLRNLYEGSCRNVALGPL